MESTAVFLVCSDRLKPNSIILLAHIPQPQQQQPQSNNNIAARYNNAPQMIGQGIGQQMINNGAIEQIDRAVFETLLAGLETVPLTFDVSFDDEFNLVVGECNHCGAIVGGVE